MPPRQGYATPERSKWHSVPSPVKKKQKPTREPLL
jgi:hypothetical protein